MRISLVIPAFNEEAVIEECLARVAAQLRLPDEVIVVDNNSSDRTRALVGNYADRLPLTLLREGRQGVAWARQAGFDAASGDVLARIDADTRLEPDWLEVVEAYFSDHCGVDGVGGIAFLYDMPWGGGRDAVLKRATGDACPARGLEGNNMAIRREAWRRARPLVMNLPGTHEDVDLSHALREAGCELRRVPAMVVSLSPRRYLSTTRATVSYQLAMVRTLSSRGELARTAMQAVAMPINVAIFSIMRAALHIRGRGGSARESPVTE